MTKILGWGAKGGSPAALLDPSLLSSTFFFDRKQEGGFIYVLAYLLPKPSLLSILVHSRDMLFAGILGEID
jgi:hypothetical protein